VPIGKMPSGGYLSFRHGPDEAQAGLLERVGPLAVGFHTARKSASRLRPCTRVSDAGFRRGLVRR